MDILFVRNLFRPADFGGNRYPWEVTRRLQAKGHRVRVVTPRPGGPLPGRTAVELRHYPVSRRTPFETFFTNAAFSRFAVRREIRASRPDVAVFGSYDVAFGHFFLREPPDLATVYIFHSRFYSDAVDRVAAKPWPLRLAHRPLDAFLGYVEGVVFRGSTRLIGVSPFSRAEIERRLGHTDARIDVVPTGVDVDVFRPGDAAAARRALRLPAKAPVLVTVGRLAKVKRYDRAIDTARILRLMRPDALLLIVGAGPDERRLREHAAPDGDAVRFLGFADGERLLSCYRAADLMLCTSDFENWSLSMLESLACGTPVVGVPRGSIPDLLGRIDPILLVEDVSPEAIAERVTLLLDDVSRRRALAAASRAVVAHFCWEATTDGLERSLQRAVATASGRDPRASASEVGTADRRGAS